MTPGVEAIDRERVRQMRDLNYDEVHDAEHDRGQLIEAAAFYLGVVLHRVTGRTLSTVLWPWNDAHPKTADIDRCLAKAGALIAAEMDRRLVASSVRCHGCKRLLPEADVIQVTMGGQSTRRHQETPVGAAGFFGGSSGSYTLALCGPVEGP